MPPDAGTARLDLPSMDNMTTKREAAAALLSELFANHKRVAIADAVAAGNARGISRRTLTRACRELGVTAVHNGPYGAFWERAA
jgi:hypothetical protein